MIESFLNFSILKWDSFNISVYPFSFTNYTFLLALMIDPHSLQRLEQTVFKFSHFF